MSQAPSGPEPGTPRWPHAAFLGNVLIVIGAVLLLAAGGIGASRLGRGDALPTAPPPQIATPTAAASPPPLLEQVARATPTATPAPPGTPAATAATPRPSPTPTLPPVMPHATRIQVPAVGIDTKIVEVGYDVVTIEGQQVIQWQVADYAAGHNSLSANPGEGGNIVISGHDDWRGEVFRTLEHVKLGDEVILTTPSGEYRYAITEIEYRQETGASLADRLATGQFLNPMPEERVTLVTCWPYGIDSHRLIVVAKPVKP